MRKTPKNIFYDIDFLNAYYTKKIKAAAEKITTYKNKTK